MTLSRKQLYVVGAIVAILIALVTVLAIRLNQPSDTAARTGPPSMDPAAARNVMVSVACGTIANIPKNETKVDCRYVNKSQYEDFVQFFDSPAATQAFLDSQNFCSTTYDVYVAPGWVVFGYTNPILIGEDLINLGGQHLC